MSYFHRPGARVAEREDAHDPPRSPIADVAERFANWFTGAAPAREDDPNQPGAARREEPATDPIRALLGHTEEEAPSRFPVAPFGYSRAVVDEHLAELERELEQLRADRRPAMSINEELERIGEQTASILVVAHDKASETTRRAQEQAERCVAEARANAIAITQEAQRRLRELDSETDAVWRERERLIDDVRMVSSALVQLADEASERFPAAADQSQTAAFGAGAVPPALADIADPPAYAPPPAPSVPSADPDATQDWPAPDADEEAGSLPEDTGSWLTGLQPPPESRPGR